MKEYLRKESDALHSLDSLGCREQSQDVPDGAHVADVVFALWVKSTAHGEHAGRNIHQSQLFKSVLEVRGVVASAAAEFKEGSRRDDAVIS